MLLRNIMALNVIVIYGYSPLLNATSVRSDNAPVVHRAVAFRSGNFFSSVETLPRYLITQKRNVGLFQEVITPPFTYLNSYWKDFN
jgi:hypothetical protein